MEGSDILDLFKDAVFDLQCTLEGVLFLSREALLNAQAKQCVEERLLELLQVCKEYEQTTDTAIIREKLSAIKEQRNVIKQLREAFKDIIKVNQPSQFNARLMKSQEHGHVLKTYFTVADGVNDYISKALAKFFEDHITRKLKEQFELVCEEMLNIVKIDKMDIEAASDRLRQLTNDTVELKEIISLLNEINKNKVEDRKKHVVVKKLIDSKNAYAKKADEPQKTLIKFKT